MNSEIAKALRNWCLDVLFPEEIFFQTLCRMDQEIFNVQGTIKQGIHDLRIVLSFLTRRPNQFGYMTARKDDTSPMKSKFLKP